jgi:hypothetical protein
VQCLARALDCRSQFFFSEMMQSILSLAFASFS